MISCEHNEQPSVRTRNIHVKLVAIIHLTGPYEGGATIVSPIEYDIMYKLVEISIIAHEFYYRTNDTC